MVDSKLTALPSLAAPSPGDITYIVHDVGGNPESMSIPVTDMIAPSITAHKADISFHQYNVMNYGAVGDGVTDDTAAIQAAINAATTLLDNKYGQTRIGRAVIQLVPGKIYLCSSPIDLCYRQGILIDGGSPVMGAVIHSTAVGKAAIECIGSQNIKFSNLEIYGDQTNRPMVGIMVSRSTGAHGANAVHITFDHVCFYGYFTHACYYGVETESNHFYTCTFAPTSIGVNGALVYFGAHNDLALIPDHATLLGTGVGPYNTRFTDCHIGSAADCRTIWARDLQVTGLVMRDCYIYGNSATYPTIEIEGSGRTIFENILFEGTPATRVKYDYNIAYVNYFYGAWRDITWGSATTYLIYADNNTDLRNVIFDGSHTMDVSGGAYAPCSFYNTRSCDFRGLAFYQGIVFDITIRNIASGCHFHLDLDDTVTFSGQHYGNVIESLKTSTTDDYLLFDGTYISLMIATTAGGGSWNTGHLIIGAYHFWIDATGDLRLKSGAPANDLDGTVVGTQT